MSPLTKGRMSNRLLGVRDVLAGSIPALAIPANSSYSLPKPQLPTFLPLRLAAVVMFLVLERDLQRARALEDLADVGDPGTLLARLQRLGHPRDRVVGAALGELGLGHDVGAALEDLDVEPGVLVVAVLRAAK